MGSAHATVQNNTQETVYVQAYSACDALCLRPGAGVEVPPGETREVSVPTGPLGCRSLQLAVRLPWCAKLLRGVRRGAAVTLRGAARGEALVIEGEPVVAAVRDISHWQLAVLPAAGLADAADVDSIHGPRSALDRIRSDFVMRFACGGVDRGNAEVAVPLQVAAAACPGLPLQILGGLPPPKLQLPKGAVVVGTVRCGYGHHRIALALCSFGTGSAPAYLHDMAAIDDSPAAALLRDMDKFYSRASRRASEDPTGLIESAWGQALTSGDANANRGVRSFCERLKPLMLALPPEVPVVAAHTLVAITALLCGCRRVVNLVFDNHGQHAHIAPPPAINVVQTPKCEQQLLSFGVPAANIRLVGHYIPKELAASVGEDTERRLGRVQRGAPRRFLCSVGGAGAQRGFLAGFLRGLAQLARRLEGRVKIWVNVGDHVHMQQALLAVLKAQKVKVAEHHSLAAASDFAKAAVGPDDGDGAADAVVFSSSTQFEAVAATEALIKAADVLVTKPSELAFYPLPKIFIRRVGDHEGAAAVRACELGDGTCEARTVAQALQLAEDLAGSGDLYRCMCEAVQRQARDGTYDGALRAFELATATS